MTESPKITREMAHELIDNADYGVIIVGTIDPVPEIGSVDEHKIKVSADTFRFGNTHYVE